MSGMTGMSGMHDTAMHADATSGTGAMFTPTEAGQGAFATIAEIVSILQSNPATDWSNVSIDALRAHLIDMSEVTLNSKVERTTTDQSTVFRVTGEGRTIASIQRMVTAHAPMLSADTGWSVETETIDDGATMTITASEPTDLAKIAALGFYGVMTIGAHHQMHHLMIAEGHDPH
ncbi:hypothetical protein [uncultured Cohaesibacter sp.]|uniref:hypothetical protein n=1 Tax=uncultured Cohaesibacter sp. TaxID=1002546 RepID=UPI0029C6875D|nr:hypothetical protein [uncultured Cohaesibacter sp.]